MIHRIILSSFALLSLLMCNTQQNSNLDASQKKTTSATAQSKVSTPKSTAPEMSTGMAPDAEAVKQAKREQAILAQKGGVIYFAEGENKFVKEAEMNVTFKRMIEDSRCPEGVNCIWEGAATAEIELMGTYTRPSTIKLSTINDAGKGLSKAQIFNGYTVQLTEVTPTTTASRGYKDMQGKYKIGLVIQKGENASGGTTTR